MGDTFHFSSDGPISSSYNVEYIYYESPSATVHPDVVELERIFLLEDKRRTQ